MFDPAIFLVVGSMGLFALVLGSSSILDALHDR